MYAGYCASAAAGTVRSPHCQWSSFHVSVHPLGCTVVWKGDHWVCDGTTTPASELKQYPVSIRSTSDGDAVIVNLGTPQPSSSTGVS